MTDQDKGFRFADGDPIGPLWRPKRSALMRVGTIFIAWAMVIILAVGVFYMLKGLISSARADESAARIFEREGECVIDADLRVTGPKRAACVDKLETAARLARAEMRVNEGRRKR